MRIPHINSTIHKKANNRPSTPVKINTNAKGNAAKVPKVPGANGASPLPKPNAKKHNGRLSSHAKLGLKSAKMIKSRRVKFQFPAVTIQNLQTAFPIDFTDTRYRHAASFRCGKHAFAATFRCGKYQFVIIAAGQSIRQPLRTWQNIFQYG